jgi:protein gp37
MQKTNIGYLTHTWNPIAMRCTPVSEACKFCWHLDVADRHARNPCLPDAVRVARGGGEFALLEKELDAPLRRKKPAVIGVQFMGDLCHKDVHDDWFQLVVAVAAMAPQHTFIILTKRADRMRRLLTGGQALEDLDVAHSMAMEEHGHHVFDLNARRRDDGRATAWQFSEDGLPPNIFWGTTVENAKHLDRIDDLLAIPGKRFLSVEPMLGALDIEWALRGWCPRHRRAPFAHALDIGRGACPGSGYGSHFYDIRRIDGVIIGNEKPPHRIIPLDHVRDLVEQCRAAGVPCFVKQLCINGKVTSDVEDFPEDLRVRELPWATSVVNGNSEG